jgi:hypothetical protein
MPLNLCRSLECFGIYSLYAATDRSRPDHAGIGPRIITQNSCYTGIGRPDTRHAPCERVVASCPAFLTLCDPQSDAARAPLPLCPRRAARSLPTPPRLRGTTTIALQVPPARSSPCLLGPLPTPESAPAPRFAPTPDASSSREARSPMTRGGATAGGRCIFGVCLIAFTRALPLEKKTSRSLVLARIRIRQGQSSTAQTA